MLNIISKDSLLSTKKIEENEFDPMIDYIVDLDLITVDFVYLILDLLEHYKLYKLCIFVCNRYKLSTRIGRYLVNIAHKYSNFSTENMTAEYQKLYNKIQRQVQLEKGLIANIALHSVLENVNPLFIKLKKRDEVIDYTNSLGNECFIELINLGFWKKCLFIMDYENSLALASTFASFKNYKLIYLDGDESYNKKFEEANNTPNFDFLPFKTPSNSLEVNLCLIALDSVIWNLTEKFPKFLNKAYSPEVNPSEKLVSPAFPSYFAYNGIFWNYILNKNEENRKLFVTYLKEALKSLLKIFNNPEFKSEIIDLRIYDLITFFILIVMYSPHVPALLEVFGSLGNKRYLEFCEILRFLIKFLNNVFSSNRYTDIIIRGLVTAFR